MFRDLDENSDGTLSNEEFREGLELLGLKMSDTEAQTLFVLLDANNDGVLQYEELAKGMKDTKKGRFAMAETREAITSDLTRTASQHDLPKSLSWKPGEEMPQAKDPQAGLMMATQPFSSSPLASSGSPASICTRSRKCGRSTWSATNSATFSCGSQP